MTDKLTFQPSWSVFLAAILMAFVAACGTDDGGAASGDQEIIPKVTATDRIYDVEDLRAAGAKASKEYDVSGLPGAISAWRALYNQKQFEARFYAGHRAAVDDGTEWADHVTGEDGVVVGDDVLLTEGASDRRRCSRSVEHSGCNYSALYADYVILGNMILLCEGIDAEEAQLSCRALIDRLP